MSHCSEERYEVGCTVIHLAMSVHVYVCTCWNKSHDLVVHVHPAGRPAEWEGPGVPQVCLASPIEGCVLDRMSVTDRDKRIAYGIIQHLQSQLSGGVLQGDAAESLSGMSVTPKGR